MAYLVDTNLIIEHSKDIPETVELPRCLKEKEDLYCSVISLTELRVALRKSVRWQMKKVKEIYTPLDVNPEIAELAGDFIQKYTPRILEGFLSFWPS